MDLIVRQARLLDGNIVDIAIENGVIVALESAQSLIATRVIDAEQRLTLPAFVNAQLHACKSFWRRNVAQLPAPLQQLPRFQVASHVKARYTVEDVFARVDETMRLAIQHGTCAIRLFADVDEASGLTALEALLKIRQKYSRWMTVQVVAFPQDGARSQQTEALLRQAMQLGADVVGGIPWIEKGNAAQQAHTDLCFRIAQEFAMPLHFVVDDAANPQLRTLEMIARQTLRSGYQGRVSCTQCAALSFYDDAYASQVIELVKEAGITIVCNSHVSLIAAEFDAQQHPWPRGITRVRQLLEAGVPLVCGQDDIDNWFYPFGRNDMLEVAHFMAHNGQFAWNGEVDRVAPLVTSAPATLLGLQKYGLHIGADANLVVLDAPDWHHALQFQADKRWVILRGELVAATERKVMLEQALYAH